MIRTLLCLLVFSSALSAQPESVPQVPEAESLDKKKTLSSLLLTRENLRKSLEEQRQKLKAETNETTRQDIQNEIDRLEKRRQELERDFNLLVTGRQSLVDLAAAPEPEAPLKLQDEIGLFITPIFSDLREMARKPREIQNLRDELERLEDRKKQAETALADVEKLQEELKASRTSDPSLHKELVATRARWTTQREDVMNRIAVMKSELTSLQDGTGGFWTDLGNQIKNFVFIRGANIALALIAFLTVLFGLRGAYYYALKLVPVKKYQKLSFSSRLLDVVHKGVSAVLAVGAALLVLYARGDWLLGGLALLAIGALLMTAKSGISKHMEDLQMMLNLGPVREGERVYINGVPWRVGAIHMFTQLTNQVIGGPGLRLPLETLSKMTSRPSGLDEPWFPCSKRAHILLNGSLFAQVADITPDRVELVHGGGLKRWMPIGDFMKADVSCLAGGFARSIVVGLDYKHQAQALTEIPELLKVDVRRVLLETMREEELVNVIVEFEKAGSSSLDFIVVGVFAGTQASNFPSLNRVLYRAALDSANRHGWEMSFPQMVVRHAENNSAPTLFTSESFLDESAK